MSTRARSLTIALVVLALCCLTAASAAAGCKTDFTATETFVQTIDPGQESFPDGGYHVRGDVSEFAWKATNPRVDGALNLATSNWNFKWMPEPVFVAGPMWGTFVLTNEGGYWEGAWTGVREENGFSYFQFVGHGGGGYEGLRIRFRGARLDPDPTAPEHYQGYIIERGS